MFKKFFGHDDEEDEVFESVDPVLEQRRKEKFSTPLIYNDKEETEEVEKKEEKKYYSILWDAKEKRSHALQGGGISCAGKSK